MTIEKFVNVPATCLYEKGFIHPTGRELLNRAFAETIAQLERSVKRNIDLPSRAGGRIGVKITISLECPDDALRGAGRAFRK